MCVFVCARACVCACVSLLNIKLLFIIKYLTSPGIKEQATSLTSLFEHDDDDDDISSNIVIYVQQDATLHSIFYLEAALHVSGGTTTHHQERIQLYLQHLVFVTPFFLLCFSYPD